MKKTSIVLSLLLICPAFTHAALVFENNFNTYTAGDVLVRAATGANVFNNQTGVADNDTDLFTRVVQDTGNIFGAGTSNNYLRLADTANTNGGTTFARLSTGNNRFSSEIGTLSFDFNIPTGGQSIGWALFLGNGSPGSANTVFGLYLRFNGTIVANTGVSTVGATVLGTYTPSVSNTLTVVFNSSISSVSYDGHTLASGTMDLWLGSTLIASGVAASGTKGNAWDGTTAQSINNVNVAGSFVNGNPASDFMGELNIDNFVINNTALAPIPEPSSVALLGAASALVAAFVCKRRRG
jgi:hypothetical protein